MRRIVAVTGPVAAVQSLQRGSNLQLEVLYHNYTRFECKTQVDELSKLKGSLLSDKIAELRSVIQQDRDLGLVAKKRMLKGETYSRIEHGKV